MIHDDGKREILISRLSLKQYYTSNGKNLPKKDSANSMATEHVFLQSVVVSKKRTSIFGGSKKSSMKLRLFTIY